MSAVRLAPTHLHSQTQTKPRSAPTASPTISTASRSVPLKAPSMWARLKLLVRRLMPMPSVMVSCGFLSRLPSASSLVYMTPRVTCTIKHGELDALSQPCQWQLQKYLSSHQVLSSHIVPAYSHSIHSEVCLHCCQARPRGCSACLTKLQSCLDHRAYALLSHQLAHFVVQTGAWGVNEVDSDGWIVPFEGG